MTTIPQEHFDRTLIPPAQSFYQRELGKISRADRRGWALADCPFHKSKSGKSFSVNLETGGYYCFGCQAKGGDPVAFMRAKYRLSFPEACKQLGCWNAGGLDAATQRRITQERERRQQEEQERLAREEQNRKLRIEARDFLHCLEKLYRRAEEQHDVETLTLLLPAIREADADYRRMAGIEAAI